MPRRPLIFAVMVVTGLTVLSLKLTRFEAPPDHAGRCEKLNHNTLQLIGDTDKHMLECVRNTLSEDITHIRVNSGGGSARDGRAIAYLLAQNNPILQIDHYCLSSCGNYFVPVAKSVRLGRRAIIGLHGTPDPLMLDLSDLEAHINHLEETGSPSVVGARRSLEMRKAESAIILEAESRFAADFDVPLGWRHYREVGDPSDGWRRHFVTGSDENVHQHGFMLVEEAMINSCLPNVETQEFQSTLNRTVLGNRRYMMFLKSNLKAYRSRGLRCNSRPFKN